MRKEKAKQASEEHGKRKDAGVQPIMPKDVVDEKIQNFPDAVIESFNELITQNAREGHSTILQEDVVKLMVEKGLKRDEIFDRHWLDVEDVYRKVGWNVKYDAPGYNETYPPMFIFESSAKRK